MSDNKNKQHKTNDSVPVPDRRSDQEPSVRRPATEDFSERQHGGTIHVSNTFRPPPKPKTGK